MYPIVEVTDGRKIRDEIVALFEKSKKSPYPVKALAKDFKGLSSLVAFAPCADNIEVGDLYEESEAIRNELIEGSVLESYITGAVDKKAKPGEYLEELLAPRLFNLLDSLPTEALHDPRFWRYLALFPFRWAMFIREPEFKDDDFGGTNSKRNYWLLVRAYQWGRKCAAEGQPTAAHDVRLARRQKGLSDGYVIDAHHSHVVRPRWCDTATVARAFIQSITQPKELFDTGNTDDTRPVAALAKRIAQVNNNICLNALSPEEVRQVIDNEKLKVL